MIWVFAWVLSGFASSAIVYLVAKRIGDYSYSLDVAVHSLQASMFIGPLVLLCMFWLNASVDGAGPRFKLKFWQPDGESAKAFLRRSKAAAMAEPGPLANEMLAQIADIERKHRL